MFSRLSDDPDAAKALSEGPWATFEEDLGAKFDDFVFTYGLIAKPSITKGALLNELRVRWGSTNGQTAWSATKILDDMKRLLPPFLALASADPVPTNAAGPSLPQGLRRQIERLRRMPIPSSVYPYAVRVVQDVLDEHLLPKDAERDLLLVESFLVRRSFAGLEPTGLHTVFKTLWDEAGGSPTKLIQAIERRKTVRFPTDDEFADDIRQRPIYGGRLVPYILRAYDESLAGDDPPGTTALTIDHVLPQRPASGWNVTKADHARLVDTWANLVPLSNAGNASKGNQTWSTVHERLKTETMWKTTKVLAIATSTWGPTEIESRAEKLVEWARARWPRSGG